jgi:hypothetical protein
MNSVMLSKAVKTQKKPLPLIDADHTDLNGISPKFDSFLIRANPLISTKGFSFAAHCYQCQNQR